MPKDPMPLPKRAQRQVRRRRYITMGEVVLLLLSVSGWFFAFSGWLE